MEFLLLGLLGAAVVWALVDAGSDNDEEPEVPVGPDVGQELTAESNALLEGGSGNDTITAGDESTDVANATLRGGEGDDLFSLDISGSEVWGGLGDDTIAGYSDGSQINGGHGNDTIDIISISQTTVNGGLGNDDIIVGGDRADVYGGGGDDRIDVTDLFRGNAYGGDGDDLLSVESRLHNNQSGRISLYGGLGDDTLRAQVEQDPAYQHHSLYGGAGDDVFEIEFNPTNSMQELISSQPPTQHALVTIGDFQPGKDQLHLDLGPTYYGTPCDLTLTSMPEGAVRLDISYDALDDRNDMATDPVRLTGSIWLPEGTTLADIHVLPRAAA